VPTKARRTPVARHETQKPLAPPRERIDPKIAREERKRKLLEAKYASLIAIANRRHVPEYNPLDHLPTLEKGLRREAKRLPDSAFSSPKDKVMERALEMLMEECMDSRLAYYPGLMLLTLAAADGDMMAEEVNQRIVPGYWTKRGSKLLIPECLHKYIHDSLGELRRLWVAMRDNLDDLPLKKGLPLFLVAKNYEPPEAAQGVILNPAFKERKALRDILRLAAVGYNTNGEYKNFSHRVRYLSDHGSRRARFFDVEQAQDWVTRHTRSFANPFQNRVNNALTGLANKQLAKRGGIFSRIRQYLGTRTIAPFKIKIVDVGADEMMTLRDCTGFAVGDINAPKEVVMSYELYQDPATFDEMALHEGTHIQGGCYFGIGGMLAYGANEAVTEMINSPPSMYPQAVEVLQYLEDQIPGFLRLLKKAYVKGWTRMPLLRIADRYGLQGLLAVIRMSDGEVKEPFLNKTANRIYHRMSFNPADVKQFLVLKDREKQLTALKNQAEEQGDRKSAFDLELQALEAYRQLWR
jgi:hypothetical protein